MKKISAESLEKMTVEKDLDIYRGKKISFLFFKNINVCNTNM